MKNDVDDFRNSRPERGENGPPKSNRCRAPPAIPPVHTQPAAPESREHTQPDAETENAPTHTASVPFMITRRTEADLRECGFSQERINTITPSETRDIL
jgi:hypothetical protein